MDPKKDKPGVDDVILIHGVDPKRRELHVIRNKGGDVGLGIVRAIEEGRPIDGDLVRLKPREEMPLVCDVEEVLSVPRDPVPAAQPHPGPARVSTEAYRRGWEQAFGAHPAAARDTDPSEVN